jgi:hypothetical protein
MYAMGYFAGTDKEIWHFSGFLVTLFLDFIIFDSILVLILSLICRSNK